MASVVSVSVGLPRRVGFRTSALPETAIEKRPVDGPVRITAAGVEGNACASTDVHGDEFMRVYAYSVEDYRWWEGELGLAPDPGLRPGLFGEQLTTEGVDLGGAIVGETWRVGTAVLQIAHVRIPCQTFKGWMGHLGHDEQPRPHQPLASFQFSPMPMSTASGTASCAAPSMCCLMTAEISSTRSRGTSKRSSSWTVRIIRPAGPVRASSAVSAACTSIIARLRMSAAVP